MAERALSRRKHVGKAEPYRATRKLCTHCDRNVSVKTFKAHKRLYFNEERNMWHKTDTINKDSSTEEEVPPSSDLDLSTPVGSFPPLGSANDSSDSSMEAEEFPPSAEVGIGATGSELSDHDSEVCSEPGEQWLSDIEDDQVQESSIDVEQDSEPESDLSVRDDISLQMSALAQWLTLYLLSLHTVFHLSDRAIECLFRFLKQFFLVLGQFSSQCAKIAKCIPQTLRRAKQSISLRKTFKRYVVCRKCHQLYYIKDCVNGVGTTLRSKSCPYKRFPRHPHARMRSECGCLLVKTVELASGKQISYPFLTYCYMSLTESIQHLFNRSTFTVACEQWRAHEADNALLRDVYDGIIWQEFLNYDGQPFLQQPHNLALMLNMDFFQPYKHIAYSVGAIYAVVMNLPRAVRYKQENVILLGLMPGPHEPKHDVNSYIQPLVNELLELWNGVEMSIHNIGRKRVRCALLCVACDLPAGRKICGFLGHSARYGCSRCFKKFSGAVGSMDYSGFNRETWPLRTGTDHRAKALKLQNFKTRAEQESMESRFGCRYSEFLKLSYFNAPRMLIVDPMHNMFLGTTKHVMKNVWIAKGLITDDMFNRIQERVNSTVVPIGTGRIPHKISSGFSSFTADQWKNWVLYYSMLVLHDILDSDHLECWRHFVLSCRALCCKELSIHHLQLGDGLLLKFCRRMEVLYGKDVITPNMHLHMHLRSCIEDYGPLHGFWLYAFERYNGILGSVPNNNRSIEVQLMSRFLHDNTVRSTQLPNEYLDKFAPHMVQLQSGQYKEVGSLADTLLSTTQPTAGSTSSEWEIPSYVTLPSYRSRHVISDFLLEDLKTLYSKLYDTSLSSLIVPSVCWKYSSVHVKGKHIGCDKSRSSASSIIFALWKSELFGELVLSSIEQVKEHLHVEDLPRLELLRAAKINSIIFHCPTISGKVYSHLLVSLSWFKFHRSMFALGKPLTVWCPDLYELDGMHSIIPVQLVKSRTVSLISTMDHESVLIVCPCVDF